ncbi:unnamed protein product [Protopolystoma xenopodis]|uniref:Uncharacterized protein n=1 Tax=Protopolystoma xenopodis TaxID=117903 RepID=A0A3S5CRY4_9PLAT|nr:unnamed protein product [Protopolystoma xenopodis]
MVERNMTHSRDPAATRCGRCYVGHNFASFFLDDVIGSRGLLFFLLANLSTGLANLFGLIDLANCRNSCVNQQGSAVSGDENTSAITFGIVDIIENGLCAALQLGLLILHLVISFLPFFILSIQGRFNR